MTLSAGWVRNPIFDTRHQNAQTAQAWSTSPLNPFAERLQTQPSLRGGQSRDLWGAARFARVKGDDTVGPLKPRWRSLISLTTTPTTPLDWHCQCPLPVFAGYVNISSAPFLKSWTLPSKKSLVSGEQASTYKHLRSSWLCKRDVHTWLHL